MAVPMRPLIVPMRVRISASFKLTGRYPYWVSAFFVFYLFQRHKNKKRCIRLYPTGDFVDGPDALEGACQLRVSKFESERQNRRERLNRERENFRVEI